MLKAQPLALLGLVALGNSSASPEGGHPKTSFALGEGKVIHEQPRRQCHVLNAAGRMLRCEVARRLQRCAKLLESATLTEMPASRVPPKISRCSTAGASCLESKAVMTATGLDIVRFMQAELVCWGAGEADGINPTR